MASSAKSSITVGHILFPLSLLTFVVFLLMAFQTSQIWRDKDALNAEQVQQTKPLEDATKLETQLDALAVGTLKLANQGDKNAQVIIDHLKQAGITVNPNKPGAGGPAGAMGGGAMGGAMAPAAAPSNSAPAGP